MPADLRLTIEMFPQSSWHSNLRQRMKRSQWDLVRSKAYEDAGHKCSICGAQGRLNCHEVWDYDQQAHTQTLRGFTALCSLCHHVKHIGLAGVLAARGELDFAQIVQHFLKVNQCSEAAFEQHYSEAIRLWQQRSAQPWRVELGQYAVFIQPESGPMRTSGA